MSTEPQTWKHKDEWTMQGKDFTVLVSRHYKYDNAHGWCVYATIRKGHPLFAVLLDAGAAPYYSIDAVNDMPLHWGCTYYEAQLHNKDGDGKYERDYKRGDIWGFKVGCDYAHDGDYYERYATQSEAGGVFHDAKTLFDYLETKAKP